MTYPYLNLNSLRERCKIDETHFQENVSHKPKSEFDKIKDLSLIDDSDNVTVMRSLIQKQTNLVIELTEGITTIERFNYTLDIIRQKKDIQYQLWIVRTYIFYNILMILTKCLTNSEIYQELLVIFQYVLLILNLVSLEV